MTEPTTLRASKEMSDWVLDIKAQIEKEQGREKRSIYRIPPLISELNKKAYQPQFVSFGPYHHGESHLKPTEHHKQRAFLHFLKRSPVSLDTIFNSMVEVAQDLKDSYDSLGSEWEDDTEKFVKLMIVDGCFMLEIFRVAELSLEERIIAQNSGTDYCKDDPIFGDKNFSVKKFIMRDMLLLENQLPMLVLFKLKGLERNDKEDAKTLNNLILKFFWPLDTCDLESLHILDLYRKGLLPTTHSLGGILLRDHGFNQSATQLKEAGIRFRISKSNSPTDISFDNGILRLPRFIVSDTTESTYQNLLAFEQCHIGADLDITSFICFMDTIIQDDRDITLLCSEGIILNLVGSDKAVANMFHTLSKDLRIDPRSYISYVTREIMNYSEKPWRKRCAELNRTYFRNPWAFVSLVAAIILFTLTILQTVFSGYDVIHK